MKRLHAIFFTLLATGSLALWITAVRPLAAQQKEPRASEAAITQPASSPEATVTPKEIKVMREYRGIKLGMNRAGVRDALGKPEISEAGKDRFKIGGDDRLTIHYDNDSVKVIQLYFYKSDKTPNWVDVVGETAVEQRPDGSKLARVDVLEEKFWVSMYVSKSGDMTTVNISRSLN
jgi:hypothetical protein